MVAALDSGLFVNADMSQEWHGLGMVVDEPPDTIQDAMILAGMDWTVESSPIFTNGIEIPGYKALTRSDNGHVLNVCKKSWTPLQNESAFNFCEPIVAGGYGSISAAVSLQGGKRIAVTLKMRDGMRDVVPGDPVQAYKVLYNSHDGTLQLGVKDTTIRPVCQNTLSMALQGPKVKAGRKHWVQGHAKIRHTKGMPEQVDILQTMILAQLEEFDRTVTEYQAMASKQLTAKGFDQYLSTVFADQLISTDGTQKEITELRAYTQLLDNFENGKGMDIKGVRGTAWAAYNAVTDFTTHQRGSQDLDGIRDRLNSIWFGSGETLNQRAHSSALALV